MAIKSIVTNEIIDYMLEHWANRTEKPLQNKLHYTNTQMDTLAKACRRVLEQRGDKESADKMLRPIRSDSFSDTDKDWLFANYATAGMEGSASYLGLDIQEFKRRLARLRSAMRYANDNRVVCLKVKRKAVNPMTVDTQPIKYYGVVHAPDRYADKDPRPTWLVITDPRFRRSEEAYQKVVHRRERG